MELFAITAEPSRQTMEKTSEPYLKKPQGLSSPMPLFLDLRKENSTIGLFPVVSWETDGRSLGAHMMPNFGGYRSVEDAYVYSLTSTETPPQKYYLNCGEKPLTPNPTKLSQILEANPDPKYNLSAKACQGILNRANKRGKELPTILQKALEAQASNTTSGSSDDMSDDLDEGAD
jgi:hypothetical protein